MYRGDLFPEWELPEFLVVEDKSSTGTDGMPATVDSTLPEAAATSPAATAGVPAEAPQVEVAGDVEAQDVALPAEEVVAETADTLPETGLDTATVADDAAGPETALEEPVIAVPEQLESTAPDMVPSTPAPEPVTEPEPEPAAADAPVAPSATVTESEAVTEQPESPAPDMVPPTPAPEPVTEPEPEPAAADAPAAPSATVTESEAVTEQLESPAPDVTPPVLATEQVTDSEPESTVAEAPAAAMKSNAGKSTYESLAAAREAYWLRDYEGAENHYRLLIELEPDNPDWHGELGNMYFAQGQWEQAAAAYYEAGVRFLNDGMVAQARQMVNVIRGLNGAEADELETQINTVDQVTQ
jgi:hypothetical protein